MTATDALLDQLRARCAPTTAPASESQVIDAESQLGFPLPPSLRRLYLEFANGGFGPAFGVYGVGCGAHLSQDALDLVDEYFLHRQPSAWNQLSLTDPEYVLWKEGWPVRVLPLAGPAGTVSYALDASTGMVLSADADRIVHGIGHAAWLEQESPTLEEWLERWLGGEDLPRKPTGPWGGGG